MSEQILTYKEHKLFIGDFLDSFSNLKEVDLRKGIFIKSKRKIENPFTYCIQIATEDDIIDIINIIKEVYRGTYPYKELEDPEMVREMIKDPNFYWVVFKKDSGENIACGGYRINLENKSGTFHAFMLKRKYHGVINAGKAALSFMRAIFTQYKGKIFHWSCEVISAQNKSQFLLKNIGMIPIAFLPKKDVFFEREVSEFIYIIYDQDIMTKNRTKKTPSLINRALFAYFYSQQKFNLELPLVHGLITHNLDIDKAKLRELNKRLIIRIEKDQFNKEYVSFQIKDSNSYFNFIHRANIHSVEKAEYKITCIEELYLFLKEVKHFIKAENVNYFEIFVSAYEPNEQKIFYNAGFKPTGYIPCWKYDSEQRVFVDRLIFVYYKGKSFNNVRLTSDTIQFLKTIRFYNKIKLTGLKPF